MSKTVNILTAVNNFLGTTSVTGDATVDTNIRPHIDSKLESFLYQNNLHKVASGANLKLLLFTIFSNAIASGITPRTSPIKAMLFDNYQSDRLDAFVIRQSALEGAPVTMHVVTCITNLETVHQNLPAVFNENRYKQIQLWAQENGVSEDQFQQKMQNIKTIAIKRGNVQPANAQGATTSFYNVETEPGFFYQFRQSGISPLIVDSTVNVGSVTSTANDVVNKRYFTEAFC